MQKALAAGKRSAFTAIELLVVIAIIGTLVALVLPGVQKVREAANRVQCESNLKQLVLSLHHYHETNGSLPYCSNQPGTPWQGWMLRVLPYLEQKALFDAYDFNQKWYDPDNLPVTTTPLRVAHCPAAAADPLDGNALADPWVPFAPTSDYGATTSVDQRLVTAGLIDFAGPGIMPRNTYPRFAEVTDGLSNTIMLAESAGRPQIWRVGQPFGAPPDQRINGGGWARTQTDFSIAGSSADGTTFPGPCAINCANGDMVTVYPSPFYGVEGTGAVYSFHAGGANIAFADGSVRFIQQGIDIKTLAALVTRAGGEAISGTEN
jgi:prepilin-type processing-associated H-X9-DG protein/prepilin-type N-terminal cleavage/methylation domain-containing protein